MKNLLNTDQLRHKYDPDYFLKSIDINYQNSLKGLRAWLAQKDNLINKYREEKQISFLEESDKINSNLVNNLLIKLKDPIYFIGLNKKERIAFIQKMRSFIMSLF